jgi:hypothetical protein
MSDLLATYVSEFRAGFPDVPFAPGVDAKGIKDDDADPMFVTLPLVAVGGKSENGFTWERPDVRRVVAQINEKKPEGMLGHIKPEERSSKYEFGKLRWVGALMDERGIAWGKAYVPPYASDARQYFKLAKRTNARVGTSVYGTRGPKGLSDMQLESIDLGHPDRLGLPLAAAVPELTSEMQTIENDKPEGEQTPMTEPTELKLVSELTTAKDTALRQVSELTTKLGEKDTLIAEFQKRDTVLKAVETLVAEFAGDNPEAKIKTLVSELTSLRTAQKKAQIDGWIAEAVKTVELEALRPTIIGLMGEVENADKAKARVEELMKRDDIKLIAEALAIKAGGPRAFVGGSGKDKPNQFDDSPEAVAKSRAATGI